MIKVAIYRTCGHLDRKFVGIKWFHTMEKADNFCKYVAGKVYKISGNYEYTIINK